MLENINLKYVLENEKIKIENRKLNEEAEIVINPFLIDELQLKELLELMGRDINSTFKVTSYYAQFINIDDYFKEYSSSEEVLIGVKEIKNDINKVCNFNLYNFKEMLIETLETDDLLCCFTFLDKNCDEIKRICGITSYDLIANIAIEKLEFSEKIDVLDSLLDGGQFGLSDIIDGIKNLLCTNNEMEALIYIAKRDFSLKELIDEYNNYIKVRQIQD